MSLIVRNSIIKGKREWKNTSGALECYKRVCEEFEPCTTRKMTDEERDIYKIKKEV